MVVTPSRILSEKYKKYLLCRHKSLKCPLCGFDCRVGDKIQTRRGNKPQNFKVYHAKCWQSLFLVCDDPEDEELEKELLEA